MGEQAFILLCFRSKPYNRTTAGTQHGFGTRTPEAPNFPQTALAPGSNRLSLAHAASPRLARSHARTKRSDFPVGLTFPTSNKKDSHSNSDTLKTYELRKEAHT